MKASREAAPPAVSIRDVLDLDVKAASLELLRFGLTIIDDISGALVETVELELLDQLEHAADEIDLHVVRVETGWGPVFIFRDRARVTLPCAKKAVFTQRPRP